jgi:hypothetical protein
MKRHWNTRSLATAAIVVLSCCLRAHSLAAQGIDESSIRFSGDGGKVPAPGGKESGGPVPRLPDGTPNLGRIEVGKGAWLPKEFTSYLDILVDPPKTQGIPFQPWAKALREYRYNVTSDSEEPGSFCLPLPAPQPYMRGGVHPIDFIQLPEQKRIIQLMEFPGHLWREIFMDGRPHPPKAVLEDSPTFMGHAIGHWDGDTLVVDTVGFNEGTWVNKDGDPHTSQMHVIEKFTRTSLNNLHIEATIDDPGAYTRPWTVAQNLAWGPDWAIKEYMCQANNRYQEGYVRRTGGATGTGNAGAEWGHGHPAKGIFLGEWGPNAGTQNRLLVQLDWVGGAIVGTINPGPRAVPITRAELNPDAWTLHIEGGAGAAKVVLDGKFENLTWLGRSLVGTYTQGNQKGTFKITRQY